MSEAASPQHQTPNKHAQRQQAARRLLFIEPPFLIAFTLFGVLAILANLYPYFAWDVWLTRAIQTFKAPLMFEAMYALSLPGNSFIPHTLTAATIFAFLFFKRRTEAAGLLLSAGGGAVMNTLLKFLIDRPRPTSELVTVSQSLKTHSFPSGHVTFYVCYFGFLFFIGYALTPRGAFRHRALLILTALPVLLIGVSRIYLGAHWASDTLGAYLFGGLWLAFSLEIYRRWKSRSTLHPEEKTAKS